MNPDPIYCVSCKKVIIGGPSSYCPHCGASQAPPTAKRSVVVNAPLPPVTAREYCPAGDRKRGIASILAIFMGFTGIHQMYVGNWRGLLYIIAPLFGVGALMFSALFAIPAAAEESSCLSIVSGFCVVVGILCIVGPWVIGIIDGVRWLHMPDQEFYQRYG